jgi:hypothetical protein
MPGSIQQSRRVIHTSQVIEVFVHVLARQKENNDDDRSED